MHRNARSITIISAALLTWAASYRVSSSFFLSPTFNSIAVTQHFPVLSCRLYQQTIWRHMWEITCIWPRFSRATSKGKIARSFTLIYNYFRGSYLLINIKYVFFLCLFVIYKAKKISFHVLFNENNFIDMFFCKIPTTLWTFPYNCIMSP